MRDDNYFDLFALPVSLPIDTSQLSLKYQQLQKQYHPDNYAIAADSEKAAIMQKSATINAAYRTLKDPVKAAEYRLSLEGIDIDAEHDTIRDPIFLNKQFELREQLDDIENSHDWDELERFNDGIMAHKQAVYSALLLTITEGEWLKAKSYLYQLRYFARLIEQIEQLQEKQFSL